MAPEPFAEVLGNPYEAWVAPLGTTFPKIDADPADPWLEYGVNGIDNQGSKGVIVNIGGTESAFTPAGGTLPVKHWRTDEALTVQFSVVDTTVELLSQVLDDAAITTTPAASGTAAQKSLSLIRGVAVQYVALLVRGLSPYDDGSGLNAQYEFSRVYQSGQQAITYLKGTPAEVDVEFTICGDVAGNDPAVYRGETGPHT